MKTTNPISPEVEDILSRCVNDAERIRVAKRLEAIAAEIWRRVLGRKKPEPQLPRFYRN